MRRERMSDNSKIKRVILFRGGLVGIGGEERLLFEEKKYLEKKGIETYLLTFSFKEEALFNKAYDVNIEEIGHRTKTKNLLLKIIQELCNIYALRRKIKKIKPNAIISASAQNCVSLYLATLFTPFFYVSHIHETMFWCEGFDDLTKYAFIHRKVFNEIRESVIGHKEFISIKSPKSSLVRRILKEFIAVAMYIGVKKAKKIFVLSNQMRWEVNKLYGKDAVVLKGAYPSKILNYKPKENIKEKLNLGDKKMILNVNRLVRRKRVDSLIKAFKQVSNRFEDVVLVIGGVGPEEERLKSLAKELNIQDMVKFVGYIKEEELWDYYASCDVFAHLDHADFDISAYQALVMQRKVVWSTEMEIDAHLATNRHIFLANPTVDDFAQAIEKALNTDVRKKDDLSMYTWDTYCGRILRELKG
jgi:glycosyltransferase involved in cell wall biosynthesis